MSRIGKKPINIPAKVEVGIDGQLVTVKGPKGTLSRTLPGDVEVLLQEQTIIVNRR
ncbi:MAG TPA: 50S ribosomal protein L6, partial [Allocoleopsis sp.]